MKRVKAAKEMSHVEYAEGYIPQLRRPRCPRPKMAVCAYCGLEASMGVDHIVPLSLGGPHGNSNWNRSCRSCNASKGTRPLEKWRQILARRSMGAPYFSPRHARFLLSQGVDILAVFEEKAKEIKFAYEGGDPALIQYLVSKKYGAGQ